MTHFVGVRLTASTFSCVIWLPCDIDPSAAGQMEAVLRDVAAGIRRIAPEMLDDVQVSEMLVPCPHP